VTPQRGSDGRVARHPRAFGHAEVEHDDEQCDLQHEQQRVQRKPLDPALADEPIAGGQQLGCAVAAEVDQLRDGIEEG
jgi:hypothetical protein